MNNMKCMVTGGLGFIGAAVSNRLVEENAQVLIYDKNTYAADTKRLGGNESKVKIEIGDIADAIHLRQTLESFLPDIVLNFAAESHVDNSLLESSPFFNTNVYGSAVLIDEIAKANTMIFNNYSPRTKKPIRLIHMSTDEVYGPCNSKGKLPCTEASHFSATNPYARSKAAADLFIQNTNISPKHKESSDIIILRSTNIYGANQNPEKMIPKMLECIRNFKPIPIYGEGKQKRCWLSLDDFLDALIQIIKLKKPQRAYNIKGSEIMTNMQLVELVLSIAQENSLPHAGYAFVEDRHNHDFFYNIDDSALKTDIDFEPKRRLSEFLYNILTT